MMGLRKIWTVRRRTRRSRHTATVYKIVLFMYRTSAPSLLALIHHIPSLNERTNASREPIERQLSTASNLLFSPYITATTLYWQP
jgi:hypothetical protein